MVLSLARSHRVIGILLGGPLFAVAACSSSPEPGAPADGGVTQGEAETGDSGGSDRGTPGSDAVADAPPPSDSSPADTSAQDAHTRDVVVQDVVTQDSGGITVTWQGGCWYTDQGHKYQAMRFTLQTANPIPLEGTLFFTTTCDASQGTDNLNDTGATIGSGGWLFWFIHHPDETNTSATWSLGNLSSGCVDYATAPDC